MTWSAADHAYMARVLQLARRGLYTTHPNPRVGCVLVKNDQVIAEGWHEYAGGPHAEINALNNARTDVTGADCYLNLEPCCHHGRTPPCTDALIQAGVKKVIAAMPDPNPAVSGKGMQQLEQAGIAYATGLLAAEAEQLNLGYIMRRTRRRPLVRCKLAMSLDGRTALADGTSKWITGPEARSDVQRLRAESAAIMTGIGTVLADDPSLNVREIEISRYPLRVVIDPQLRFRFTTRMLKLPGRTLICTFNNDGDKCNALQEAGAEVITFEESNGNLPGLVLNYLAEREECNEVLLESGARLAGSMLSDGLIDEIILYQAPALLGDGARGLFHLPGIETMSDKIELALTDIRRIGEDVRITLKPLATSY